jgi:hypothetical protein
MWELAHKGVNGLDFGERGAHGSEARKAGVEFSQETNVVRGVPKSIGSKTITKIKLGVNINTAVHGLEFVPNHARGNVVTDRHETLSDRIETTVDDAQRASVLDPPCAGS